MRDKKKLKIYQVKTWEGSQTKSSNNKEPSQLLSVYVQLCTCYDSKQLHGMWRKAAMKTMSTAVYHQENTCVCTDFSLILSFLLYNVELLIQKNIHEQKMLQS